MKKNNRIHFPASEKEKMVIDTPFGKVRLARKDATKVKKTILQLERTTDSLTRKDIGDWRNAWQLAINVEHPNRQRLYDIYRDVEVDLHLSGCIQQREGFVMARSFKIVNAEGVEDAQALNIFNAPWFKQLLRYALQANYWGHSLIELGNVITVPDGSPDGKMQRTFDSVTLIPRKHVIPEYHRVIRTLSEDWHSGIDYHDPSLSPWLIEVGQPDNLGLFLKAALQTIPKKNALAFWDTFAEIFGMPMRIARTNTRDDKELAKIERMLKESGLAGYMVADQGTELEFVEASKTDAYNVYDKRVDRSNSEISKLIIGQTMTIEDGSSLSQSQTHLEVFQNIVEADCDMLRDIVNTQLLPRMVMHGFPVQGLHFEWDYSTDYTPEQQRQYEELVLNHYEVEPEYFREKYNMPVTQRKPTAPDGSPVGKNKLTAPGGSPVGKNKPTAPGGSPVGKNSCKPFFD